MSPPPPPPKRFAWKLAIGLSVVIAALGVAACHGLPGRDDVPQAPVPKAALAKKVSISGAAGELKPAAEASVIRAVQSEGRAELVEHHLRVLAAGGEVNLHRGNTTRLLIDGPPTFAAMQAAIEAARHRVLLESYIIDDGPLAQQLAALLERKVRAGVSVAVLYDAVGSFATGEGFFARLAAAGVAVCKFNPLNPAERPGAFGLVTRNHRKLLVVDDEAAFTGGINISSVYASGSGGSGRSGSGGSGGSGSAARAAAVATGPAGAEAGAEAGWRDTHVELRGPVVPALARSFASLWADQRCEGGLGGSGPPRAAQPGDRVVKLVEASPGQGPSRIYTTLLAAVEASRRSVHLTMAYFAPGPEMVRALADAARRGVEVSLVLPGRSDVSLVMQAGRSYYDEMLEAGVHIHEMGHTVMHAKTVVIDGVLATVGSSNMDWRSFTGNHELNVVLLGRDAGAEFEALFARDVAASRRIEPAAWAARGFRQRAHESLARLIEPLL